MPVMTNTPTHYFSLLSILASLIVFSFNLAAQEPEWQLGAALSTFNFRLYPGSAASKTFILPLPYFSYTSDLLEIDRGIRGLFPSSSDWYLDVSADFGLPVSSDDTVARSGMPNLDAIIQIGPSLEYSILGSRYAAAEFRLELPLRTAISVSIDQQANQGWIAEPRLVYEKRRAGTSGLFIKTKLGLRYATQDYHAYYYDVTPAYVTPERALFKSDKGYSGLVMDVSAAWRQNNIIFWGILRYQNLNHSAIQNSPLIEKQDYYLAGLGITWILAASH